MSTKVASLYAEIGADTTKLKRGLDETKDDLKKTGTSFDTLKTGALAAAGVIAGVGVALKGVYDIGKEGAQLEFTAQKFDRLAESIGTTGEALSGDLKAATSGLMSDSELMASATDLMALGLVKTHDEAVRLTTVAGQLGMNMNQLVLTLTNRTTMRFDALGVSVDGFKEKVSALEEAGLSAEEAFSEAFLQQAEEQLERVGSIAETSAGKIAQMESAVKNLGDTIKVALAPAVADAAEAIATQINYTTELNDAIRRRIITEEEAAAMQYAIAGGFETQSTALEWVTEKVEQYENAVKNNAMVAITGFMTSNKDATVSIEEMAAATEEATIVSETYTATLEDMASAMENARDRAAEAADSYYDLAEALADVSFAENINAQIGYFEALKEEGKITQSQFDAFRESVLLNSGRITESSIAEANAYIMSQTMIREGLKLTKDEMLLLPGIISGIASDGVVSMSELEQAFIDAGFTTQEEVDKMNGIDLGEATGEASEFAKWLAAITNTPDYQSKTVDIFTTNYVRTVSTGSREQRYTFGDWSEGGGYASGADFVVPPGYPNDSFPLRVQSGEHVKVTPAGQTSSTDRIESLIEELPQLISLAVRDGMTKAVI